MSFNSEIKDELLSLKIENDCCMLAQICACINTIGSLEINKQGISFSVLTENVGLLTELQKSINTLYANKYGRKAKMHLFARCLKVALHI